MKYVCRNCEGRGEGVFHNFPGKVTWCFVCNGTGYFFMETPANTDYFNPHRTDGSPRPKENRRFTHERVQRFLAALEAGKITNPEIYGNKE